jgi:hypothetical protein
LAGGIFLVVDLSTSTPVAFDEMERRSNFRQSGRSLLSM